MKQFFVLTALLTLALLCSPAPASAEDAAMVMDLKNGSAVYTAGMNKGREVQVMDFLAEGDAVELAPQAVLVLNYFASGLREEITGPGAVTVGPDASRAGEGVSVRTENVEVVPPQAVASVADDQHAGVVVLREMMSPDLEMVLLGLKDTAVRDLPLHFKWAAVEGASNYRFKLVDAVGNIVYETRTTSTDVVFEKPDLVRGDEYVWTVDAMDGDLFLVAGEGRFYLLSEERRAKLVEAEAFVQKHYPAGSTEADVVRAMLCQSNELNDEALAILVSLRGRHPGNPNIVRQIQALRGNYRL